jgi:transmembrane sensor
MRNDTIKPTRQMIAEASAWLIEFRTDEPTQNQRDRFNAWLCTSPQHIQAYFEVAAAWSELPDRDPEGRFDIQDMIRIARESNDRNIVKLSRHSLQSGQRREANGGKPHLNLALKVAIAATLLIALTLSTFYVYYQRGIYATTIGEQRSLTLADGSTVELNAQTQIRVRYSENERHIDLLKGQALFHVARNKTRPFIVDTGETQVRAVGTQFDVYRKSSGTIVTVIEGRVAVVPETPTNPPHSNAQLTTPAPIFLAAGEQLKVPTVTTAKVGVQSQAPVVKHADIQAATAWTQKRLVFEDTPLSEVAEEFNRYSTRPLVITDPTLQRMGVTGHYSSADPTALIAFLNAQPNILVAETETEIVITPAQAH